MTFEETHLDEMMTAITRGWSLSCLACAGVSANRLFCVGCVCSGEHHRFQAGAVIYGLYGMAVAIADRQPCKTCGSTRTKRRLDDDNGRYVCDDYIGCTLHRLKDAKERSVQAATP